MLRRDFFKHAGAGIGIVLCRAEASAPRVAAAAIVGATGQLRCLESVVPADQLVASVDAHLELTAGLVTERLHTPTGFGLLAEVAGLAAWLAADRGDDATARRRYREAVDHAGRAHHPLLRSYMTASLGQFAVDCGDVRRGLDLLDLAAGQLGREAPDAARAWLGSLHAVAQARAGDRRAALCSLRAAGRAASSARGEPRWPWVFAFDEPKAARYRASALTHLGDARSAVRTFEDAGATPAAPKAHASAQLDHAAALVGTDAVGEACDLAMLALGVGRSYRSERIIRRVRELRRSLPARASEVARLDAELDTLYGGP